MSGSGVGKLVLYRATQMLSASWILWSLDSVVAV